MRQCKWCGRHYKEGTGASNGLFDSGYCSERCREEDRKAPADGGGTKPYRWVWWVIAILVLAFMFHK